MLGQTFAEAKIKLRLEMNLKMKEFVDEGNCEENPRQLIIDRFLHSIEEVQEYACSSE